MTSDSMKLYRAEDGVVVERAGSLLQLESVCWDAIVTREDLFAHLSQLARSARDLPNRNIVEFHLEAPIGIQEVWAAGVTYFRSRNARMEESKSAGGGDFYDRVYNAERPELFFKSTPHR